MIELSSSERYVIINADDLGLTRSTNQAIIDMFVLEGYTEYTKDMDVTLNIPV